MNVFDLPIREHPYLPEDEMWALPGDLSDEFCCWESLSRWQRAWLTLRFRKAVWQGRAVIIKTSSLADADITAIEKFLAGE